MSVENKEEEEEEEERTEEPEEEKEEEEQEESQELMTEIEEVNDRYETPFENEGNNIPFFFKFTYLDLTSRKLFLLLDASYSPVTLLSLEY